MTESTAVSTAAALPVIDLGGGVDLAGGDRGRVAAEINQPCRDHGFFYIHNHGVPQAVIDAAVESAQRFFGQPLERKASAAAVDHRGYVADGEARMKGAAAADLKESFVIGRDAGPDEIGLPLRSTNRWPAGPPEFRQVMTAYFDAVAACGRVLLGVVARALEIRDDFFEQRYDRPLQRMNVIHYPPSTPAAGERFGVAPHTDYGCITLLWQDDRGGLEVQDRRTGDWIAAVPTPGTFVVNVGDLLERWSNGRLRSNLHRVRNASGAERYSIATFFDPSFDAVADPVDLGVSRDEARYKPVGCGDYILGRIRESFEYRPTETR